MFFRFSYGNIKKSNNYLNCFFTIHTIAVVVVFIFIASLVFLRSANLKSIHGTFASSMKRWNVATIHDRRSSDMVVRCYFFFFSLLNERARGTLLSRHFFDLEWNALRAWLSISTWLAVFLEANVVFFFFFSSIFFSICFSIFVFFFDWKNRSVSQSTSMMRKAFIRFSFLFAFNFMHFDWIYHHLNPFTWILN